MNDYTVASLFVSCAAFVLCGWGIATREPAVSAAAVVVSIIAVGLAVAGLAAA